MNLTESFLGEPSQWARAQIRLADVHGLWGGREIVAAGWGRVRVRRVSRGMTERRWEYDDPAEVRALLQLLAEVDFVSLEVEARAGIPDEARPAITLINHGGQTATVAKWAGQKVERFDRVYERLLGLESGAEAAPPEYEGPFDPHGPPDDLGLNM